MEDRFKIGVVTQPHGIHGEFKVFPTTDDMKRFSKLKNVIVETKKDAFVANITSVKYFKQFVILKIEGYDTMDDAEKLRQAELFVERKDAVKLKKNEYFIADLIDMKVLNEDDTELGTLTDVYETGANDVYAVTMADGKELMIPAIKQCILDVNIEERVMKVHLLPGLMDL